MFSQERFKATSLLTGAAAGMASGFLGFYYMWRHHKSRLVLEGLGPEGTLQPIATAQVQSPSPIQLPTAAQPKPAPSGPSEEQLEIRWHLDSIQNCLDGLKAEVSSLKECIQSIVEKQTSLRKPKSSRKKKRRYESKRDSDDSTESVSIYFTANPGKATDSESETGLVSAPAPIGQVEVLAELDSSMLAFAADSFTDDRTGLDAESPFLQYQPAAGYTAAHTDIELEKDEERDSSLVQILNFSPALEPEPEPGAMQYLMSPEIDQNEMRALLEEVDRLHGGSKEEQEQGFKVLLDNKNKYGKRKEFCWRMIRAYSDMTQLTEDKETQKCYALAGRDEATASLQDHGDSIECQICYDSIVSDPANISEITEVTNKIEEQDMQTQHEGNILVDVINSYDNVYTQRYTMPVTDSSDVEDRNKEEDMQAIEEANLMVQFIDGYHMTFSDECNLSTSDVAQTADTESEYEQQSATAAFKAYYLSCTFKKLIATTERHEDSVLQFSNSFNIKNEINIIEKAWGNVSKDWLLAIWWKLLPDFFQDFKTFNWSEDLPRIKRTLC
ncbi:regulator of microtubule dynamics protein 3-like isoform X2 [Stegostoma tigrinum]|uniref:regulator of microtubule dynamics protein 3-like isoform X2 n=1 Tax=Stegostoma tigrinum TaxID=3053191 RepID=UPI00202B5D96|nr:regulator of microtubule dynamics protein 3-like isoform X2 [Stegostoma tigrinum]